MNAETRTKLEDRLHRMASEVVQSKSSNIFGGTSLKNHRPKLVKIVKRLLKEQEEILPVRLEDQIVESVVNRISGLGPIEPYLRDPHVTEIMVNAPDEIFVEKGGVLEKVQASFRDEEHILNVIDRIVAPLGRRVDESVPFVDARLPDGSRVNAIIPPLALRSPALTIRRFSAAPFTLSRLVNLQSLTEPMAHFLRACVQARINILISGGTGSGKTSTLNALARCISDNERLVTIEDTAELQLHSPNFVSLESRPPNIEGKGEVTIRTLVRNALRMRPDRIIVGEVRGPEAFDMLQAMNTGHPGSLTTIHANSPVDAIRRIESMVLMAGLDLPQPAIREQIANSVDVILQQERLPGGARKVVSIAEVSPFQEAAREQQQVEINDIFIFERQRIDKKGKMRGQFCATGYRPHCLQDFKQYGYGPGSEREG